MLYLANGNRVQWLRYGEWLLTCPVSAYDAWVGCPRVPQGAWCKDAPANRWELLTVSGTATNAILLLPARCHAAALPSLASVHSAHIHPVLVYIESPTVVGCPVLSPR